MTKNEEEVFIVGGGCIYEESFKYVDKIYITLIDRIIDGDTYFPGIDENAFKKTYEELINGEIQYTYYTYERKL